MGTTRNLFLFRQVCSSVLDQLQYPPHLPSFASQDASYFVLLKAAGSCAVHPASCPRPACSGTDYCSTFEACKDNPTGFAPLGIVFLVTSKSKSVNRKQKQNKAFQSWSMGPFWNANRKSHNAFPSSFYFKTYHPLLFLKLSPTSKITR